MSGIIVKADARFLPIADNSVQCVITSPPYWGLRDYGNEGQIGLETTPQDFVESIREVGREVWRVLKRDGTFWLNLGDSYSGSGKGGNPESGKQATNRGSQTIGTLYGKTGESARHAAVTNVSRRLCTEQGIKPKDLMGIPWRVALALQSDGWWLRSDIIWAKPNPMPESVLDRPTRSHEYMFLLTKNAKYYYNAEAIKEPTTGGHPSGNGYKRSARLSYKDENGARGSDQPYEVQETRNKRDVWFITPKPYKGAHYATFPAELIEPCILAGSRVDDIVLDPFSGSGTTAMVAKQHGRQYIALDLGYQDHQIARINSVTDPYDAFR